MKINKIKKTECFGKKVVKNMINFENLSKEKCMIQLGKMFFPDYIKNDTIYEKITGDMREITQLYNKFLKKMCLKTVENDVLYFFGKNCTVSVVLGVIYDYFKDDDVHGLYSIFWSKI